MKTSLGYIGADSFNRQRQGQGGQGQRRGGSGGAGSGGGGGGSRRGVVVAEAGADIALIRL